VACFYAVTYRSSISACCRLTCVHVSVGSSGGVGRTGECRSSAFCTYSAEPSASISASSFCCFSDQRLLKWLAGSCGASDLSYIFTILISERADVLLVSTSSNELL
jgi:hypothetical protein